MTKKYSKYMKIGEGGNGKAYLAREEKNHDDIIVIKSEVRNKEIPTLQKEAGVLQILNKPRSKCQGVIPKVILHGFKDNECYLGLEQLGPSLEMIKKYCGGKLSMKTTLMIGI